MFQPVHSCTSVGTRTTGLKIRPITVNAALSACVRSATKYRVPASSEWVGTSDSEGVPKTGWDEIPISSVLSARFRHAAHRLQRAVGRDSHEQRCEKGFSHRPLAPAGFIAAGVGKDESVRLRGPRGLMMRKESKSHLFALVH